MLHNRGNLLPIQHLKGHRFGEHYFKVVVSATCRDTYLRFPNDTAICTGRRLHVNSDIVSVQPGLRVAKNNVGEQLRAQTRPCRQVRCGERFFQTEGIRERVCSECRRSDLRSFHRPPICEVKRNPGDVR